MNQLEKTLLVITLLLEENNTLQKELLKELAKIKDILDDIKIIIDKE